jgi:single-strand DNA-binding protein
MNLNRAMIIGNLTRDPESRTTATGQSVCNFSIATSSQWTDAQGVKQERTEYHSIVAWGKLADICTQYLTKGRKAYVEGRLQTREWEGQDGSKKQRTEIVAENMIILDRPPQGGQQAVASSQSSETPAAPAPKVDQGMGDNEIRIEDIPF